MDDRKIYELTRLKLAYYKQIVFLSGAIALVLLGMVLYIINVYRFDFALFIVSLTIILTGLIGIMTIDEKIKAISGKIKNLER
ncbi:MAG: hypothetical protein KatS3mg002_0572 [Candidatus Woesearchaeota archaeon]|nr:MAG: hypothetical protein KatS3mg002_0572 [Candidatus Woesearchaeota archaeon]